MSINQYFINNQALNNAVQNLRRRGEEVLEAGKRALEEGAKKVVRDAKDKCPVKSGRLRESIKAERLNEGALYEITANAKSEDGFLYGQIVEYSPKINRPFLYPAMEENRQWINEHVREAIRSASRG